MSEKYLKLESNQLPCVNVCYQDQVNGDVNDKRIGENEQKQNDELPSQELTGTDQNQIMTMLNLIKRQLNEIQQDVNDMKRKFDKLEDSTSQNSSKLFKVDSSLSTVSNKINKLDKSFAAFNSSAIEKKTKFQRPEDFPEPIECDNFETLQEFDRLLSDYEGLHAVYFIELLKEKFNKFGDYKKFLRCGFHLLMTRSLQLQCSYTGKNGYAVNQLHCVILLQAVCRTQSNVSEERIKQQCSYYFSNLKGNFMRKAKKFEGPAIKLEDSMDASDF